MSFARIKCPQCYMEIDSGPFRLEAHVEQPCPRCKHSLCLTCDCLSPLPALEHPAAPAAAAPPPEHDFLPKLEAARRKVEAENEAEIEETIREGVRAAWRHFSHRAPDAGEQHSEILRVAKIISDACDGQATDVCALALFELLVSLCEVSVEKANPN